MTFSELVSMWLLIAGMLVLVGAAIRADGDLVLVALAIFFLAGLR